jgi:hypothetical protein
VHFSRFLPIYSVLLDTHCLLDSIPHLLFPDFFLFDRKSEPQATMRSLSAVTALISILLGPHYDGFTTTQDRKQDHTDRCDSIARGQGFERFLEDAVGNNQLDVVHFLWEPIPT